MFTPSGSLRLKYFKIPNIDFRQTDRLPWTALFSGLSTICVLYGNWHQMKNRFAACRLYSRQDFDVNKEQNHRNTMLSHHFFPLFFTIYKRKKWVICLSFSLLYIYYYYLTFCHLLSCSHLLLELFFIYPTASLHGLEVLDSKSKKLYFRFIAANYC